MTISAQTVIAKRGDTFNVPFIWKPGGVATSLDGMTIVCEGRDPSTGVLRCSFVIVPDPDQITNPGAGRITKSYNDAVDGTQLWPAPSTFICDVQFTAAGVRNSTDTFTIRVLADVTT